MKWLSIICFLFCTSAISQTPVWTNSSFNDNIQLNNLQSDSLGFLWFHYKDALYRYDGYESQIKWSSPNKSDITSLSLNEEKELVLVTQTSNVYIFSPYTLENQFIETIEEGTHINVIHFKDSNKWAAISYGKGVYIKEEANLFKLNTSNGLLSNEVYDICEFQDKYYVSSDQGIQEIGFDKNHIRFNLLTKDHGLSDIIATNLFAAQKLWYSDFDVSIGSIDSNEAIDNYAFTEIAKNIDIQVHDNKIYVARENEILVKTTSGWKSLFKFKSNQKIKSFCIDVFQNLWFASTDNKLFKANISFEKQAIDLAEIQCVHHHQNRLFLGSKTGLFLLENNQLQKLSSDNVTSLNSNKKKLWVGTFSKGIKVYDQNLTLVYKNKNWSNIENESVLCLYSKNDNIWVSSLSGVTLFEDHENLIRPVKTLNDEIGKNYVYTILQTGDKVYFGTDRKGLKVWDMNTKQSEQFELFNDGSPIGSVYAIAEDQNQNLFFSSTNKGISKFVGTEISSLDLTETNNGVYTSLCFLDNNILLAIKNNSIDFINPNTLNYAPFDKDIGLSDVAPFLNNYTKTKEATYFIHDNHLYNYKNDYHSQLDPKISLDPLYVNLEPRFETSQLGQDENNIQFSYSASWLADIDKLSYQYQLVGYDATWRSTKDRTVSYAKLTPGRYQFKLKASINSNFRNAPIAIYPFEIKKHWYNQIWFRIVIFLVAALLYLRWRKLVEQRKLEKANLEKSNIEQQLTNLQTQLNPHFLFNSFNTLMGLIEEDPDKSIVFVQRMTDFYRKILEYGQYELISLSSELELLSLFVDILKERFDKKFTVSITIEDEESYSLPPMSLQLLVENAIKHNVLSRESPLLIEINQKNEKLKVLNIHQSKLSKTYSTGTGLVNLKRRFELLGLTEPLVLNNNKTFEVTLYLKKL